MEYPIYKKKKIKPTTKILFTINMLSLVLCLFIPWYVYIQGSITLIFMAGYVYKKYRGYKLITAFMVSLMAILLLFDFADRTISWSLSYVMPSFFIFLTTLMVVIVLIRKRKWNNYYSMHIYFIITALAIGLFMIFGLMESLVMGIVTLSIFAASLIAIWIRVGKHYHRSILKFIHI